MMDCDITVNDIKQANQIYGTTTPLSKGNKKRKKRNKHPNIMSIPFTLPIENRHRCLNMYMEIFYLNEVISFL